MLSGDLSAPQLSSLGKFLSKNVRDKSSCSKEMSVLNICNFFMTDPPGKCLIKFLCQTLNCYLGQEEYCDHIIIRCHKIFFSWTQKNLAVLDYKFNFTKELQNIHIWVRLFNIENICYCPFKWIKQKLMKHGTFILSYRKPVKEGMSINMNTSLLRTNISHHIIFTPMQTVRVQS